MLRYSHRVGAHDFLLGFNYGESTLEGGNYRNLGGMPNGLFERIDNDATLLEAFAMDRWALSDRLLLILAAQSVSAGRATLCDGQLFISGQLPVNAGAQDLHSESVMEPFSAQAHRALSNMLAILAAAGGSTAHLARVTAYIVGIGNWESFDGVYSALLGPVRPARVIVPVPELHYGYLVEVDAIAVGIRSEAEAASSTGVR